MKKIGKQHLRLILGAYRISLKLAAEDKKETFEEAVKGETFKHPDTGNDVQFGSLPSDEQKKIRESWKSKNDSLELSDEDKKLMEEFREMDLSEEEIFDLFSKLEGSVDAVDEDALKELESMDKSELEDQLEQLFKNFNEEELTKAVEDALKELEEGGDDEEDDDDDDDDKETKARKKRVKKEQKEHLEEYREEYDNLANNDYVDEDYLNAAIQSAYNNDRIQEFADEEAFEDTDGMSKEELVDTLKSLASADPEWAKEMFAEADKYIAGREREKERAKKREEKAKREKEEKAKKEQEKKEKKEKHKKREVSSEERAERKKKLDSAISKIDDISFSEEELGHDEGYDYHYNKAVGEVTAELTKSIEEAYGLEREDDDNPSSKILGLDNLDDDELDTIMSSITSSREKLNKKYKEQIDELKKLSDTELRPDLNKTSRALQRSYREFEEINKRIKKETNGWKSELPEDHPLMVRSDELDKAIEELSTKQYELDFRISEIKQMRSNKNFGGSEYEEINSMFSQALAEKSGRDLKKKEEAEVKAMQEAEEEAKAKAEKEEQERQEKIKAHTKKLSDIQSSASSAKSSEEVTDLLSEFGRIKGQLSGSNMMDDLKGDIDKTQKALDDAKEKNSLSGRVKNFFGLGKKASKAQRHKVAKIALELLQEEIALYKEEEARRNRKR